MKISLMEKVILLLAVLVSTSAPAALNIKHYEFDCERTTMTGKERAHLVLGIDGGRMSAEVTSNGQTQKGLVDQQYKPEANSGLNFRYEISKSEDILIEDSMSRSGGRNLNGRSLQGGHLAIRKNLDTSTTYKIYLCVLK